MPIRLKSLELHGYKTFATKTEFEFAGGITAVIGPNGSGKSNIADAIRWVLGEQSYGLLRGKKTEDMIFAGSELRPRAGMASASLTFDNSDGWLPVDFVDVAIGRRAYRDGENEYFLNGQRVRLRDLDELLARCGLAERTYTIVGQGLIESALSLKAEERRALFEEAAGVGLSRAKREEALRRLDATQRNLERAQDILAELRPRLRSLERQSQRLGEYDQVRTDLKSLLRIWYGFHWHAAQERLIQAREQADSQAATLAELNQRQQALDQTLASLRHQGAVGRGQLAAWQRDTAGRVAEREALAKALAVADERSRSLAEARDRLRLDIASQEGELSAGDERLATAQAELAGLQSQRMEAERQLKASRLEWQARDAERVALEAREREARHARLALSEQVGEARARLASSEAHRNHLGSARRDHGESSTQHTERLAQARSSAEAGAGAQAEATDHLADLQVSLSSIGQRITTLEAQLSEHATQAAAKRADEERLRARLEGLGQAEGEMAGTPEGTRALLSIVRQGRLPGARGTLSERLNVPASLEQAIGAALGAFTDALLLGAEADLQQALDWLDGSDAGRAALLPLDHLRPAEPLTIGADADVLGVASTLVSADADLRPALEAVLGHTLVVRDTRAARRVLPELPRGALAVTLRGEVFYAAGPVLAGRDSSAGTLRRRRERSELNERIALISQERQAAEAAQRATEAELEAQRQQRAALEAQRLQAQAEAASAAAAQLEHRLVVERLERDLQSIAQQIEQADADLQVAEDEHRRLAQELTDLQSEQSRVQSELDAAASELQRWTTRTAPEALVDWQTQAAVAARAAQDAQARLEELRQARAGLAATLDERRTRADGLAAELETLVATVAAQREREAAIAAHLDAARQDVAPLEQQLAEAEAEVEPLEAQQVDVRSLTHTAERRHAQAQLDLALRQEELEGLRRRIEEDFGLVEFEYVDEMTGPTPLPLGDLVEKLTPVEALPEGIEDSINRRRGQLRRMGAINPEAQAEYREVKERFEFLTAQVEDLQQAELKLREVIAELDQLMQREFLATFEAVAAEFHVAFGRLFDGGSAKLVLTDPDNLTASGVDIQARLPGRRTQGLAMLSGGERSLTACALTFALLRVSPTPFCVLDEVDAMLDESNVTRYREMLRELSAKTQFVVITHNRHTVQAAEVIYGVSMAADSSSQVIGLRLEEVAERMAVGD